MKKVLLTSLIPLFVFGAQYAMASSLTTQPQPLTPWNEHTGFYTEINAGPNLYAGVLISGDSTFSSSGFQGAGWNANLGYFFNHNFAMEAGFMQNYAKFDLDQGDNLSGHTNMPYITTRFSVPMGDQFSFIAKVGLMDVWVTDDTDKENTSSLILPFTGVGISYAITPKLEASVQYQGALYGVVNLGLLSVGLTYHF